MPILRLKHLWRPRHTAKILREYLLTKPHRAELFAEYSRKLTKIVEPEKWVFIVGCYDSGTTLLAKLLATHSQISRLDEGVFKTSQLLTPEELGWPRLWCQVVDQVRLKAGADFVNVTNLKKDWMPFFDQRKAVFLEKSIVNSARMTWLQENFPNSYFIFIIRNGYAVAEGIRRNAKKALQNGRNVKFASYPIELCAQQWVTNNEIVENDAKEIRFLKRVFYEGLCAQPYETIASIYTFLGLTNEAAAVRETRQWQIHEYDSEIKNMNEKSIQNLSREDIQKIEKVAEKMLTSYGYRRYLEGKKTKSTKGFQPTVPDSE